MGEHRRMLGLALVLLLSLPASCARGAAGQQDDGTDALRHVGVLAADSMGGRGAATVAYARAAAYARRTLESAGARPPQWPDGQRSMLQDVPLLRFRGADSAVLELQDGQTPALLRPGDGRFVVYVVGRLAEALPPRAPIFVGYGISDPDRGWDDFARMDVRGRIVLMVTGAPSAAHVPDMPAAVLSAFAAPPVADGHKVRAAIAHGAAAVLSLPDEHVLGDWDFWRASRLVVRAGFTDPTLPRSDPPLPLLAAEPPLLRRLFAGQELDPTRTGVAFRPFELRGLQLGLRLPSLRDTVASPNVVAVVEGKDARLRQEYVVVSAHLDHLGTLDGRIYNGANDDASGSAVVLSLARAIAAQPPRRSVIFALFTAEEHGLIGSRYFVLNPPVPLRAIKAELNLDQVGRLPNGGLCDVAGPESMGAAIWASLGKARPLPVRFTADTSSRGIYPSSDHYSFHGSIPDQQRVDGVPRGSRNIRHGRPLESQEAIYQ